MTMMSAAEAQRELAIGPRDLRKLAACGLLAASTVGRTTIYGSAEVGRLAMAPHATPAREPTLVVRLGEPMPTDDPAWPDRKWAGWHEDWDENTKQDAARGFWRVREPDELVALVAVVSRWVVATWSVRGYDKVLGYTRVSVAEPSAHLRAHWLGHQLDLHRGPTSVVLGR